MAAPFNQKTSSQRLSLRHKTINHSINMSAKKESRKKQRVEEDENVNAIFIV